MRVEPPLVSFVTAGSRPGAAANNECRWLTRAFSELGVRYDAVYLEGPAGVSGAGSVREVRLGTVRARSSVFALGRYLRDATPGVTVASPSHIGPIAAVAGALARRPVVPWEGTLLSRDLGEGSEWPASQRWVPRLQRLTYWLAPRVAANSADVGADLLDDRRVRDPARIFLLPNPVGIEEVRAQARPAAQRSSSFRFCAVGRLVWQKAYDVMIEAFAQAAARLPPDWELVILGDGPRRLELAELARRHGLERHISFLGHVEPYSTMASADVFVHAARWEGFGIVLTEALSLELPIVATACPGGPREILDGGRYGLLVAPDDPGALAEGLVRAANDEALRSRLRSCALEGAERFSSRAIAMRLCELAAVVK